KFLFNSTTCVPRRTFAGFSGGKRVVIVHSDTEAHKFDDELSQIYVAFVKGLKRSAVLVKTFLILTATTQRLL
ncbi:MAG: hypothetical protein Q7K23_09855, partial [Pseudomonas sp.]|nr:hypothetical protein [Pseudomonas sp.]